jgi:hypothetical protein
MRNALGAPCQRASKPALDIVGLWSYVKFSTAIDDYIRERRSLGRINSDRTERDYRIVLNAHAEDVGNRDPAYTSKEDVKRTLRRWAHPNSLRKNHSVLRSFYDWAVAEELRPSNPARALESAKPKRRSVCGLHVPRRWQSYEPPQITSSSGARFCSGCVRAFAAGSYSLCRVATSRETA